MILTSAAVKVGVERRIPSSATAIIGFISEGQTSAPEAIRRAGKEFAGGVERLISAGVVSGKAKEIAFDLLGDGKGARRVVVVGLGKSEKITTEVLRRAAGQVLRALKKWKVSRAAIVLPAVETISPKAAADAVATGVSLAAFEFREFKGTASKENDEGKDRKPIEVSIIGGEEIEAAVERSNVVCAAQNYCRTVGSRPANDINPVTLAKEAQAMARQSGLRCRVLDEKEMARLGMGGILAVGGGSIPTPPRMIVLQYRSGRRGARTLMAVGKAITFDTGGISIKPAEKMGKMIFDKCGGMAVLGFMHAVAKLKLPIDVVGILASAENAISSRAYRPGDILRMYNGVTVDVTNTDAEGRLVLGDALAWGIETYKPTAVVDLATLTGGVVVALGKTMAGVMSNSDSLVRQLAVAGEAEGEIMWRLPFGQDQRDFIKAEAADIVNAGGREGHPLQGGAFLSYFVPQDESVPWAHLDIAGVADTEKELPYYSIGATGWGVRTLVRWAEAAAAGR
jgi:leucyl aminopeptidase